MAGNNLAVAAGKIQIKREIQKDDDEDPLDLGHNSDLRSSGKILDFLTTIYGGFNQITPTEETVIHVFNF